MLGAVFACLEIDDGQTVRPVSEDQVHAPPDASAVDSSRELAFDACNLVIGDLEVQGHELGRAHPASLDHIRYRVVQIDTPVESRHPTDVAQTIEQVLVYIAPPGLHGRPGQGIWSDLHSRPPFSDSCKKCTANV
ncbi:MAG: hypothetical protein QXZ09_06500 [Candidatus Methanomethylicaceae archaeon]